VQAVPNIRTLRWVCLVFQRPAMHRIHDETSRHRNNCGDRVWQDRPV
jgi:hypothetical protein